jgi:hypothetical protein
VAGNERRCSPGGFADKVADFTRAAAGRVAVEAGPATKRFVEVVIEAGAASKAQLDELSAAAAAAAARGVTLIVRAETRPWFVRRHNSCLHGYVPLGARTTVGHVGMWQVFGEVVKVRLADGSGAWWKATGEFIGFLERFTSR